MAVGYDWCYDRLTPAQRAQFRTADGAVGRLGLAGDQPQPRQRLGGRRLRATTTITALCAPGSIGLALAGDSPKAPGYIDLALPEVPGTRCSPTWRRRERAATCWRGPPTAAAARATSSGICPRTPAPRGEDLFHAPGFLWPQQAVLAKLYLTTPTRDRMYPGGDQARDSAAPLSDYDRSADAGGAGVSGRDDGGLREVVAGPYQSERRISGASPSGKSFSGIRNNQAGVDYTQALPTGYLAAGAGWMTSRSGWDHERDAGGDEVGPTLEDHQDRAQNGFMIFRGEWLAANGEADVALGADPGGRRRTTRSRSGVRGRSSGRRPRRWCTSRISRSTPTSRARRPALITSRTSRSC